MRKDRKGASGVMRLNVERRVPRTTCPGRSDSGSDSGLYAPHNETSDINKELTGKLEGSKKFKKLMQY